MLYTSIVVEKPSGDSSAQWEAWGMLDNEIVLEAQNLHKN